MKRSDLEHLIRAAGAIADDDQVVVIGSQSILGQLPDAPRSLRVSMAADVYPANKPERADLVEGSIGEGSFFLEQFGYYAQGVGPRTAVFPAQWRARVVSVKNSNTGGVEGLCLEVHDFAIAKYVAGREKDHQFNRELARHRITRSKTLLERLEETPLDASLKKVVAARIRRDFARKTEPKKR